MTSPKEWSQKKRNANLQPNQQCKVTEIKKNVGSLSEREKIKIMTNASSGRS